MAPAGQGQSWSHVLCCLICDKRFSLEVLPVNLACGHVVCRLCVTKSQNTCPVDESTGEFSWHDYPVNVPLFSVCVQDYREELVKWKNAPAEAKSMLSRIEKFLVKLASYLKKAESERGGSVFSELLSRTMQRKLVTLICFQLVEEEGRSRALKSCRALADRIITEIITSNITSNPSTQLWSVVRARGCQFLGPAMQEDVLNLILLALGQGAQIARKTLVIYVVQMLTEDYPQVSKTCVGHVVQLLYRASCFHVIKRDGESSLMQLKEEFRTYETLRKEHDAQIVQMAMEAGLRISPDQWSSLLYGDLQHRSHMQSIIDKMQSPQSYQQGLYELGSIAKKGDLALTQIVYLLEPFGEIHPTHYENVCWKRFHDYLEKLTEVFEIHVGYIKRRNEIRQRDLAWRSQRNEQNAASAVRYKTKMCRDVASGQACPRGNRCTWAHSLAEIQESQNVRISTNQKQSLQQSSLSPSSDHVNYQMGGAPPMSPIPPNVGVQRLQIIHEPEFNKPFTVAQHVLAPPPAPHHDVVPMVPLVVQQTGRPHPVAMQPPAMVLMTHAPPPNMVMNTKIWQGSQQAVFLHPHPTSPQQAYWLPPQNPGYPMENGHSRDKNELCFRGEPDADQLVMKRKEILSLLAPLTHTDDEEGDDSVGHVSYTVASSVLDERMELHPHSLVVIGRPMDLPTMAPVISPTHADENMMLRTPDMVTVSARQRAPSVPFMQSVPIPCPEALMVPDGTVATVQADCAAMQIRDAICQPLPTAGIQPSQVSTVAFIPALDPCALSDRLPVMPPPPAILDPQGFVSSSLDKIVDVKERLNEAEGAPMSSAVSQQLRVELQIAEREMKLLDPRTQASCLLRELEQVDRELERIEASRPPETNT